MIQEIDFNPELFNDLYWELEKDLNNPDLRYIWLYGGSSASKTYTYCQSEIIRKLKYSDDNAMVIRKYGVDIKDSIYADFVGIINDWGLSDYFKIQINYIECLLTGSYIRFRGLDDSEKIKGLARFKRVVYEEISQGEETDLKQIRKRLRGKVGQQIIGLFNPISEEHWIKVNVFDKSDLQNVPTNKNITSIEVSKNANTKVYRVTYLNNYFIVGKWIDRFGNIIHFKDGFNPPSEASQICGFVDKHTIEDFEKDKINDYGSYEIYALGLWGNIRTGGEFYKNFKKEKHIRSNNYNPSLPLHISWDDNVNPYLPCGIFQIVGLKIQMIDEIAGENPNNTVKAVCDLIKRKYPNHLSGMFIYGDATANKQDTKIEKGHNFYTLVMQYLAQYRPVNRVSTSNPSVVMRGNWINSVLASNESVVEIEIGENCKKTINDLSALKEAADGTKLKEMITDKETKVRYQKVGHFSDCLDYILCTAFKDQFDKYSGKTKSNIGAISGAF